MAAADLARQTMRFIRNRFSYEEVENFVRDATSNTNEPPEPKQIRLIADAMLDYDLYPKAFHMLWRRLCHLEYKRHVAKALLVLDSLVRIRPPSKAVQLRLMVDIRERWPEIYRLAKLRPSSSSETIAQIQRVAERLCAFIMGYESGYILPTEADEDTAEKTKKSRRRRKRRTETIEEIEVGDYDNNEDGDEVEEMEVTEPSKSQPSASVSQYGQPAVSPFGFDFFAHQDFDWAPPPSQPSSVSTTNTAPVSQTPTGWECRACTFINGTDKDKCEICGSLRHQDAEEKKSEPSGWACDACSFINKEEATVCEVCETHRHGYGPQHPHQGEGETETAGYPHESEPGEGDESDENDMKSNIGPLGMRGGGSTESGSWSCAWCSWSNPPSAQFCEVCDKESTRSGLAQQVKLQIARKHEAAAAAAAATGAALDGKQSWSCPRCSRVNPANRSDCSACGFHSPYATEMILSQGQMSAGPSVQATPNLSPTHSRASSVMPDNSPNVMPPMAEPVMQSRSTGFAVGMTDVSQQRLEPAVDPAAGGGELLAAVTSQQEELTHQLAALQHYNQQKEKYREQYGWSCPACSFLNDPHNTKCEICDSNRPTKPNRPTMSLPMAPQPPQPQPQSQVRPMVPSSIPPLVSRPSAAPVQSPSPALLSPAAAPATDWPCQICTFLNSLSDENCSMCNAPKPASATNVAGVNSTAQPSLQSQPSLAASGSMRSEKPLLPQSAPPSVPLDPRRATHPLPSRSPSLPASLPPINATAAAAMSVTPGASASSPPGKYGVLDNVLGGQERGPAPAHGTMKFPAQYQLQEQRQQYEQEMARQQIAAQQAALAQQRMHAQAMLQFTAPQQLAALPPMTNHHQRNSLKDTESWLAAQHEQQRQQQAAVMAASQQPKGNLDDLMNDFFSPRGQDRPVDLFAQQQQLQRQQQQQDLLTVQTQRQQRTAVVSGPGISPVTPSRSPGATASPYPEFHSMFDAAANGFAQDLMQRRGTGSQPATPVLSQPQQTMEQWYTQQQAAAANQVANNNRVLQPPAPKSPAPFAAAPPTSAAIAHFSQSQSGESKPRRDRSPQKREARASLPLDQLKLPLVPPRTPSPNPFDDEGEAPKSKPASSIKPPQPQTQPSVRGEVGEGEGEGAAAPPLTVRSSSLVNKTGTVSALAAALAASADSHATEAAKKPPPPVEPKFPPPPSLPVVRPKPPAIVAQQPIQRSGSASLNRSAESPPSPISPAHQSISYSASTNNRHSPSSKTRRLTDTEKREKVRDEILSTEKFYVACLNDLLKHFMDPIKRVGPKIGVEPRHIQAIFQNLTMLAQFHSIFLADLQTKANTAEVFVQFADFLKMYTQYIAGYEKSIATINSLRANKHFTKLIEEKRDELKGRGIMTYLIMPVQRIPRYVLLLRELAKYTPESHSEHESLMSALHKIESIADHINENKRQIENMSKLLDIQNRMKKADFVIFKPDRRLIKEGMVKRVKEEFVSQCQFTRQEPAGGEVTETLLFLFNDLLLWTSKEFDIVGHTELETLTLEPDTPALRVIPSALALGTRTSGFRNDMVFQCKDDSEKEEWTRYILSAINNACDPSKHRKTNSVTKNPIAVNTVSQSLQLAPRSPSRNSSPIPIEDPHAPPMLSQARNQPLPPQPRPVPLPPSAVISAEHKHDEQDHAGPLPPPLMSQTSPPPLMSQPPRPPASSVSLHPQPGQPLSSAQLMEQVLQAQQGVTATGLLPAQPQQPPLLSQRAASPAPSAEPASAPQPSEKSESPPVPQRKNQQHSEFGI